MKILANDLKRNHFDYFLGKIVMILTNPSTLSFNLEPQGIYQHFQHFGGMVEGFDEYGIWLRNKETKSFFFFSQIIGIIEQQQISEDHPAMKKALEVIKEEEEEKELTIEELQKMIEKEK